MAPEIAAAIITIAAALLVGAFSGLWAVRVRSIENDRAEWRRLEELTQIVHHGVAKGLWAQQVAVAELVALKRRRPEVRLILTSAEAHFRALNPPLADHIKSSIARIG